MIIKTTEKDSKYSNLEKKSVQEILSEINLEDSTIADSVKKCLPQINNLISKAVDLVSSRVEFFT